MSLEEEARIRKLALEHAVHLTHGSMTAPYANMVLAMAREFEQYLLGKDKQ